MTLSNNTKRNQTSVNNLVIRSLKLNGFNPTLKDGVVSVGHVVITSMQDARKLSEHMKNLEM